MSIQKYVEEFHDKFRQPIGKDGPQLIPVYRAMNRANFIEEELEELREAIENNDLVEILDAVGDLAYLVYGTAVEYGFDLDDIVKIIHESNMSKLDVDGRAIVNTEGKVTKGPNYFPPTPKIREYLNN